MIATVNKVILVGNVGRDPELRSFENGGKLLQFSMATSEMWKDSKTGEKTSHTDWHNIVIKRPGLVEIGEQYIHKGSRLYLEGKVRNRSYTSNSETKYITEIVTEEFVLLSPKTSEAVSVHDVMLNEPAPNSDFALENAMEESPY